MNFLFETATLHDDRMRYYRLYETSEGFYFAESVSNGNSFNFWKGLDGWETDTRDKLREAQIIGETIEQRLE